MKKIPVPAKDEKGNVLHLEKFQEHSVRDILRTLDQGAVMGTGTARGALLGDASAPEYYQVRYRRIG